MGFLASDPYLKGYVDTLGPMVMTALRNAADALGGTKADAACLRWFGSHDKQFKQRLARDLRQMRAIVNVKTISIGSEDLATRDPGVNAAAWNAGKKVGLGDAVTKTGGDSKKHQHDDRNVFLDAAFPKLPRLLPLQNGKIKADGWNQSQLNTFIHELTHLLIGTNDEVGVSGEAYGAQRAEALAKAEPAKAQTNAENWGIFVEAVGHHGTS